MTVKSTRNTKLNYYLSNDNKTVFSIDSITATKKQSDITLLEHNDAIILTGKQINDDAAKNRTIFDFTKNASGIDTGIDSYSENKKYYLYGSPYKWVLDNRQQYNNCGVDAALNILVMAGIKEITNQNKVESDFTEAMVLSYGYAEDSSPEKEKAYETAVTEEEIDAASKLPGDGILSRIDGATEPTDIYDILELYKINSDIYYIEDGEHTIKNSTATIDDIANAIKNGGAAIVAVNSTLLWSWIEEKTDRVNHAVTVTGVVYDKNSNVAGFYIHDTGAWMTRYISLEEFKYVSRYDINEWKNVEGAYATIVTKDIKANSNNINATGNNYSNTIKGNSGNNIIKGLGGNDYLYGYLGEDKIYGGGGNDQIYGGDDNDILYGDSGKDTIYGGLGIDEIHGGSGNDTIFGEDDNDIIYGDAGNDIINGGDGDDYINAGAGNDTINGNKGTDTIYCGNGNDTIVFDADCGNDIIYSSSGSVTFCLDFDLVSNWQNFSLIKSLEKPEYSDLSINYETNTLLYKDFYSINKNKCQTLYVLDENDTKYRYSFNLAKGKVSVANTKGNNVLNVLSAENNSITTGKYSDIVYMLGGDDTISYTGGKDFYQSASGNNTYNVNKFDKNTKLNILDFAGNEDKLVVKADKNKLCLFVNYDKTGNLVNNNLYIYNKDVVKLSDDFSFLITDDSLGCVCIEDYFSTGCIETISAKTGQKYTDLDIDTALSQIQQEVVAWFNKNSGYENVLDAVSKSADNINELIAAYVNTNIQI